MRPSWDEVWMATADVVAARSLCSRAKVGAVIVSEDNIVRAASYNGPPPGFKHNEKECSFWCRRATADELMPTYEDCWSTHAEMSAIARADRSTLEGATIYVTSAMCMPCAKVIPQTGITHVVHRVEESAAHRSPDRVEDFLDSMGVDITRVIDTPESVRASFVPVDVERVLQAATFIFNATCNDTSCEHIDCTEFMYGAAALTAYADLASILGLGES